MSQPTVLSAVFGNPGHWVVVTDPVQGVANQSTTLSVICEKMTIDPDYGHQKQFYMMYVAASDPGTILSVKATEGDTVTFQQ